MLSSHRSVAKQKAMSHVKSVLNEYVSTSLSVSVRMREVYSTLNSVTDFILPEGETSPYSPKEIELFFRLRDVYQEMRSYPNDIHAIIQTETADNNLQAIIAITKVDDYDKALLQYAYEGEFRCQDEDGSYAYKPLISLNGNDLTSILHSISLFYQNTNHSSMQESNAGFLANCKWITLNFDMINALLNKIKEREIKTLGESGIRVLTNYSSIPMQRIMRIKSLFNALSEHWPTNEYATLLSITMEKVCDKTNLFATFTPTLEEAERLKYSKPQYLAQMIFWIDLAQHSFREEYVNFIEEKNKQVTARASIDLPTLYLMKIDEEINKIISILYKKHKDHEDAINVDSCFKQLSALIPLYFITFNEQLINTDEIIILRYMTLSRVAHYMKEQFSRALVENNCLLKTNDTSIIAAEIIKQIQDDIRSEKENEKEKEERDMDDGHSEKDKLTKHLIEFNLRSMLTAGSHEAIPYDEGAILLMINIAVEGINTFIKTASNETTAVPSILSYLFLATNAAENSNERAIIFAELLNAAPTVYDKLILLHTILAQKGIDKELQASITASFKGNIVDNITTKDLSAAVIRVIKSCISYRLHGDQEEINKEIKKINILVGANLKCVANRCSARKDEIEKHNNKKSGLS